MKLDNCMQEKCNHNLQNTQYTGDTKKLLCAMCPPCPDCFAPNNMINPDCKKCLRCENVLGYMRDKDPMKGMTVEEVVKVKEQENVKAQVPIIVKINDKKN